MKTFAAAALAAFLLAGCAADQKQLFNLQPAKAGPSEAELAQHKAFTCLKAKESGVMNLTVSQADTQLTRRAVAIVAAYWKAFCPLVAKGQQ